MEETQERKKNNGKIAATITILAVLSLMVVAIGLAMSTNAVGQAVSTASNPTVSAASSNVVAATGTVKEFTLSMKNGIYQPYPITVNKGDTVRLIGDLTSITGCYRTVVIPKFGVRKTLTASDKTIEFVASEAGTFRMTCGMNMAGGSIVVQDAGGTVPVVADVQPQTSGGCGGSGGGCGCGGR